MRQGIYDLARIGDPTLDGFTLGAVFDPDDLASRQFVKADHPGVRGIRIPNGTIQLVRDLPDVYTVPAAAGGGGSTTIGPVGILGYAEITANQTGITTITDITGLSVAVTVGASRRIRVSVHVPTTTSSVATDRGQAYIREGSTQLAASTKRFSGINGESGFDFAWIGLPSAGSHTYKASYARITGTGNHEWNAGTTAPAFIMVEDITLVDETISSGGEHDLLELWY
jgi:hypothetical protein